MDSKTDHIIILCKELQELGINIESKEMDLILQMQEQDFKSLISGIDTATEFELLLSKIHKH